MLNIFNTREGQELRPDADWSNLDMAKVRFQDSYLKLSSRRAGGVISIYFHPCEFVHKQFWDAVNFADGANPPPDQWKLPSVKSPEDTEKAFQYFEDLVRFLKSFPRVQFITASEAADLFRDPVLNHVFSAQEVAAIAGQVDANVSFQEAEGYNLTASEVFYVINRYMAAVVQRQGTEALLLERTPWGPSSTPQPLAGNLTASWSQVARTILDVQDGLDKTERIPAAVWLGSQSLPPESYLVGIAQAAQSLIQNAQLPSSITFAPARLAAADYVADDSPDLWDWAIFPHGFHAPKLMSLAKLQAWTLKPATK